jgi:hypothetical protein
MIDLKIIINIWFTWNVKLNHFTSTKLVYYCKHAIFLTNQEGNLNKITGKILCYDAF